METKICATHTCMPSVHAVHVYLPSRKNDLSLQSGIDASCYWLSLMLVSLFLRLSKLEVLELRENMLQSLPK